MAEKFRTDAGDPRICRGGSWPHDLSAGGSSWSRQYFKMLLGTVLVCLCVFLPLTQAQDDRPSLPAQVQAALDGSRLAGSGELRYWGLRIYDARLWTGAGFEAERYDEFPLVLDLTYHRAFDDTAIAQRSIQEMQRQGTLEPAQRADWEEQLARWLPSVQPGDRLLGLYLPGYGLRLWQGGQAVGVIADPELGRRFVGIWLAPQTSEPGLRLQLLGQAGGAAP